MNLKLDSQEIQTAVWLKVSAWAEARIAELRTKNDGDHSHEDTTKLRGRIAQLKELQALGAQPEPASLDADA